MKDFEDLEGLRAEFDAMSNNTDEYCADGSCPTDEEGVELRDYPSYTEALYAKIVAPHVSGIYLSRWDIKDIAAVAGDSMSIHPRKRMFELLMKFAVSQERMQLVLDALETHMQEKIAIYEEISENFPHSAEIFQEKIDKAEHTIKLFPYIMKEYF
ncbi:MAG: Unknown protein [uncultured Sulfurovum sp.]|uniref:Uncharacterized protein n=1 Tax=uncultured Sulfurovum sp. TaxID=269237 RepID=A0A6S6T5S2_9BACT|nr:MAG: Unknown protein [uncultured Sulfurovum sp.]